MRVIEVPDLDNVVVNAPETTVQGLTFEHCALSQITPVLCTNVSIINNPIAKKGLLLNPCLSEIIINKLRGRSGT